MLEIVYYLFCLSIMDEQILNKILLDSLKKLIGLNCIHLYTREELIIYQNRILNYLVNTLLPLDQDIEKNIEDFIRIYDEGHEFIISRNLEDMYIEYDIPEREIHECMCKDPVEPSEPEITPEPEDPTEPIDTPETEVDPEPEDNTPEPEDTTEEEVTEDPEDIIIEVVFKWYDTIFVMVWENIMTTIYIELLYNHSKLFTEVERDCHCSCNNLDSNGNYVLPEIKPLGSSYVSCGCNHK